MEKFFGNTEEEMEVQDMEVIEEFEEVEEVKEVKAPAVARKGAVATKGVASSFSIDLPREMEGINTPGMIVGDIGMRISKVPVEKYKASTQRVDRIGFVSAKVIGVKTHYIKNKGGILCFGGKCCDDHGMPSIRYLFPIVVYSTDNEGNLNGSKFEIRTLSAGEDLYKSILTIKKGAEHMGGIDWIDCFVTCTDDTFQKITLAPCGPAAWRMKAEIGDFIKARMQQDYSKLYMAVARSVDEAGYAKMMESEQGGDTGVSSKFEMSANTDIKKYFE